VQDRTREQQRVEKLLEDARIKISSVYVHGVTGRAMMDALIAGERDPRTLADLAKRRARKKTDRLEEPLRGFFTDHHAMILQMMLGQLRPHQRPDRRTGRPHHRGDRPFLGAGGPPG
jgi:transposase